jgi:hypothetical protein
MSQEPENKPNDNAEEDSSEALMVDEIALGGTPAGVATNEALRALSRAARSFLIYDPRNEAIRGFLQEYQRTMYLALEEFEEMILVIRPFEMLRGAEVVYLERDRERSLAFRLFRDGVRRIEIDPEVKWEELLRLLEILSIRFTGIRQQEDDIVTLLLKSGFKHIEIAAVEGFVPDDEEYCGDDPSAAAARNARKNRQAESHVEVPRDWDLPLPEVMEPVALQFVTIPKEKITKLQDEGSSKNIPHNTVRLVVEMLKVVGDPTDPTTSDDIDGLINEVRDFLLSESQLDSVLNLVEQAEKLIEDPDQKKSVLGSFTNERAIRKIIGSLPKGISEAPQELKKLMSISPINHLPVLMEILSVERREASRRVVQQLMGKYIEGEPEKVIEVLPDFEGSVAADLMKAVYDANHDSGTSIIFAVDGRTEPEVQFQALTIMKDITSLAPLKDYLFFLLKSELEDIRAQAMELLVAADDKDLFPALQGMLERSSSMSIPEAIQIGEALARSHPGRAKIELQKWIKPQKWYSLNKLAVRKTQQYAAVAGLSLLPGTQIVAMINRMKEDADELLADFCIKVIVRRRRLGIDNKKGAE